MLQTSWKSKLVVPLIFLGILAFLISIYVSEKEQDKILDRNHATIKHAMNLSKDNSVSLKELHQKVDALATRLIRIEQKLEIP